MSKYLFALLALLTGFLISCGSDKDNPEYETIMGDDGIAFLYQTVGAFRDGVGENAVRLGYSDDAIGVGSYDEDALLWEVGPASSSAVEYGDPVVSRLSNGQWALTAWTRDGELIYGENSCPIFAADDVAQLTASSASGCQARSSLTGGKSSQVFASEGNNYVFTMIGGRIYLNRLTDTTYDGTDLSSICVLEEPVEDVDDLAYGESTLILSSDELLLSDTAIAQREDGTWVLFVKGINKETDCEPNTPCELCARNIYRSTSTDLTNWSEPENVVSEASVPDASTMPGGEVRLYWQDFSIACGADEDDFDLYTARAPISTAYETDDAYALSESEPIEFADEDFESDDTLHYATNANPVLLPDSGARKDYEACF
jgi:hypothetical protein